MPSTKLFAFVFTTTSLLCAMGCEGALQRHDGDPNEDLSVWDGGRALPDAAMVHEEDASVSVDASDFDFADASVSMDMDRRDMAQAPEECLSIERDFLKNVYAKVLEPDCQSCHNPLGIASASQFVLELPEGSVEHISNNYETVSALARRTSAEHAGTSWLLLKPSNQVVHGGGEVLAPGSQGYLALERFVAQVQQLEPCEVSETPEIFTHLVSLPDDLLWRRIALDLGGRLPTPEELEGLELGTTTLPELVDALMQEDMFLSLLVDEGFNDLLHLAGSDIQGSRLDKTDYPAGEWYNDLGLDHNDPVREGYRDDTTYGLKYQAYALIRHLITNELPFTQILTADYTMVNYASARAYGVEDQVDFGGAEDRTVFQPAVLPAPTRMKTLSAYPHAGIVSTHTYLKYYSTTETNRNRGRARVFYEQFLGTNLLEIAPQGGGDSQAVIDTENPVRDAAECNVCHYIVDPAAGAFQNFDESAKWAPRRDGWYDDSFAPGFVDVELPEADTERALQWFAHQVVEDPRFAQAMVANTFEMILGRRPMSLPREPDQEGYLGRLNAYTIQQRWLRDVERDFIDADYNLKVVVRAIVLSPYYRTSHLDLDTSAMSPDEFAAYEGLGVTRLLTPEQLDRKIIAVLGEPWVVNGWRRLLDGRAFYMLYAGIDSKSIFERLREMSPMMASIATTMSGEVSCRIAAKDFELAAADRRLFPHVTLADTPSTNDAAIRLNIQHLYRHVLGEHVALDGPEVELVHTLFANVQTDGVAQIMTGDEKTSSRCSGPDEFYTMRAWLAVVTFMLEDWQFLYH